MTLNHNGFSCKNSYIYRKQAFMDEDLKYWFYEIINCLEL
jgi:hypothetical protein